MLIDVWKKISLLSNLLEKMILTFTIQCILEIMSQTVLKVQMHIIIPTFTFGDMLGILYALVGVNLIAFNVS